MQKNAFGIYVTTQEGLFEELPWDFHDLGAMAVETRDSSTMSGVADVRTVVYIAGFEAEQQRNQAVEALGQKYPELEMTRMEISDDGWSEGWKKFFRPVVLDKLQVVTPWMTPPRDDRETIVIDPGQAFGTGGHATTKLMLQMIEDRQSREMFPDTILDVGTGSGVLAIACAKLGAPHIFGFDVEAPAIDAARENAVRNDVASRIDFKVGSPEQITGSWPLVLANIQLAVFIPHAVNIASFVAPNGHLYISGILEEQYDRCLALWPAFRLLETQQEGEWLAMHLEKHK